MELDGELFYAHSSVDIIDSVGFKNFMVMPKFNFKSKK